MRCNIRVECQNTAHLPWIAAKFDKSQLSELLHGWSTTQLTPSVRQQTCLGNTSCDTDRCYRNLLQLAGTGPTERSQHTNLQIAPRCILCWTSRVIRIKVCYNTNLTPVGWLHNAQAVCANTMQNHFCTRWQKAAHHVIGNAYTLVTYNHNYIGVQCYVYIFRKKCRNHSNRVFVA